MHISCTNTMQLIPLLLNRKQISSFILKTVEIYEVPCSLWFCSGKKWALRSAMHLELIISAYFILTSIEAKAFIRIKLGRAIPSLDPYMAPYTVQNRQFSAVRSHSSWSLIWLHVRSLWFKLKCSQRTRKHKMNLLFCPPPGSHQRRSTRPGTPLWSSSAPTIQSTRKAFTSATPAPSSRTHCTHASDQRGPEGAVRGRGANEGAPRGGASLTLGNLRPPRWIRHDRTTARPPNAPQLLGALSPPTDCEE